MEVFERDWLFSLFDGLNVIIVLMRVTTITYRLQHKFPTITTLFNVVTPKLECLKPQFIVIWTILVTTYLGLS